MDPKMRDLNQKIIKFDYEQNFKNEDFYVSKSNKHIFNLSHGIMPTTPIENVKMIIETVKNYEIT